MFFQNFRKTINRIIALPIKKRPHVLTLSDFDLNPCTVHTCSIEVIDKIMSKVQGQNEVQTSVPFITHLMLKNVGDLRWILNYKKCIVIFIKGF